MSDRDGGGFADGAGGAGAPDVGPGDPGAREAGAPDQRQPDVREPDVPAGIERPADTGGGAGGGLDAAGFVIQRRWGRNWIHYLRKGTHLVYLEAEDIDKVPAPAQAFPDGITFLREEGLSDPWVFFREKRGSRWFQGDFRQSSVSFAGQEDTSACLPCHGQIHDTPRTEGIFSIAILRRFLATRRVQELTCNPNTNSPCSADTYR